MDNENENENITEIERYEKCTALIYKGIGLCSYFGLQRYKHYHCTLDKNPEMFIYRLHKHYLQYKKIYQNGDSDEWAGVWSSDWYNELKASYYLVGKK